MTLFKAEKINQLDISVGVPVELESLRQALVPPFLMVAPFVETPAGIVVDGERDPHEDGVIVRIFTLRATSATEGNLIVGFRNLLDNQIVRSKTIRIRAR